jgi:hypothetical protein
MLFVYDETPLFEKVLTLTKKINYIALFVMSCPYGWQIEVNCMSDMMLFNVHAKHVVFRYK